MQMLRLVPTVIGVLAVGFLAVLGPIAMDGAYSYVVVDQSSWEPKLSEGELAIIKRETDYQLGQLVTVEALQGQYFGQIVGVEDRTYMVWKGDAEQPVPAAREEVIGRLWFSFGNSGDLFSRAILGPFSVETQAGP